MFISLIFWWYLLRTTSIGIFDFTYLGLQRYFLTLCIVQQGVLDIFAKRALESIGNRIMGRWCIYTEVPSRKWKLRRVMLDSGFGDL